MLMLAMGSGKTYQLTLAGPDRHSIDPEACVSVTITSTSGVPLLNSKVVLGQAPSVFSRAA